MAPSVKYRQISMAVVKSSEFTLKTFLLVEPDIPCPVVVCGATQGVVLRRDVLKFLRNDQHVPWDRVWRSGVYLPVQEESPGSRVWGDPSRDYITKVLWNTIGSRKDIRMERISVEVHDLYDSWCEQTTVSGFEDEGRTHIPFEFCSASRAGEVKLILVDWELLHERF